MSDTRSRLFRFGFLLHARDTPPNGEAWKVISQTWRQVSVGDLVINLHPETVYRDFSQAGFIGDIFSVDGDIEKSLSADDWDALSGRFVAIVPGQRPYLVQDAFGSRTLYYRQNNLAVASHAEILSLAYGNSPKTAAREVIGSEHYRSRTVKYLPGDWTMYEGVFALPPNHLYLLEEGRIERYWPRDKREETSFDLLRDISRTYLRAVVTNTRQPIIGVTGGIDSRILLAAYLTEGAPFRGVTWGGGWLVEAEVPIIERIVKEFGVEHTWLHPRPGEGVEIAQLATRNSGGFRGAAKLTGYMSSVYDDGTFLRGYGGEIMRGFYNLHRKPADEVTPLELARLYSSSSRLPFNAESAYGRHSIRAFEEFLSRTNYDEPMGYDINDLFYWEHRMGMWGAAMLNEMDAAVYSTCGLNNRKLFEAALGLPSEIRLSKKLLADLCAEIFPPLSAVPYK